MSSEHAAMGGQIAARVLLIPFSGVLFFACIIALLAWLLFGRPLRHKVLLAIVIVVAVGSATLLLLALSQS
ncbi:MULTISPECIES: hypothetical protein [unclassified Devosia]|uniref:hypothetical protein n=1 Tax=unclassified Devosia TaxID=196773 RepID=UPI00086D6531|nr:MULTISPECIES: hypothetical protein [unclassified Devosia]MBN9360811.1 hypothetical protein [Devosia sp.]ODS88206.1 MAG: hypothetical protein ABS47_10670 [Devosia sp. SCN 66-27]OJX22767.1 MAG: hypothetical protein BGO83_18485 [Devosia sp. 66-14]